MPLVKDKRIDSEIEVGRREMHDRRDRGREACADTAQERPRRWPTERGRACRNLLEEQPILMAALGRRWSTR